MALKAMRELPDYVMEAGSPDVEGWQVHDRNDQVVGTVIDLIVDTRRDEVRYLVIQLTGGKDVLMPVGDLDLDEAMGVIRAVTLSRADLEAMPAYASPTLSSEVEERYYILFRREEPVGAADMSPLDYRIPPFRARGERMEHLMRGPRRLQPGQTRVPVEGERLFAQRREDARLGKERGPVKGMPGPGPGLFAANDPWNLAQQAEGRPGEFDRLGADADREALWQSEQPGMSSAMGAKRDLPEEKG